MLHGALGAASQLEPLRELLGAIPIEFPGHGTTPLTEGEFSMTGFARYADRLLPSAGPIDLFGYSMGGYVALLLALKYPGSVRRVMTLGTKFEWTPAVAAKDAARLNPDVMEAKVPAFTDLLKARHTACSWRDNLAHTATLLHDLGAHPLLGPDELARITQHVCIAVGDLDVTVTADECARVAGMMPKATVAILAETSHPFEQLDHAMLAARVGAFFAEADA